MEAKVCMVSGSTSGIGLATVKALAQRGMQVVVVGRNAQKGRQVVESLEKETGNPLTFIQADLSVLAQVRRLADEFKKRHSRLDVLVNNVGGFFRKREQSADGIELTLALNLLGPFLLTNLLLDEIRASAAGRIVNVSSDAQRMGVLDLADLERKQKYSGMKAYAQSKLGLLLFTYELARRLEGERVTVNALHPGFVATNIGQDYGGLVKIFSPIMNMFAQSPEQGADTSVYLAAAQEVDGVSGKYFIKKKMAESAPVSYDKEIAGQLWQVCEKMTGLGVGV